MTRTKTAAPLVAGLVTMAALLWVLTRPRRPGQLIRLQTPRPDLLAFELRGQIDKAQIRRMAETVLAAFQAQDEVDLLVLLPAFSGLTPQAALDLKSIRASLQSLAKVRRYAVVAPPALARAMIQFSDLVLPVEARTFALSDLAQARAWVGGGPDTV